MKRFTLDPANPPQLSAEERERLDAMTDDEITRAAESDPDNPPLTADEIGRFRTARVVRRARANTGLSQSAVERALVG